MTNVSQITQGQPVNSNIAQYFVKQDYTVNGTTIINFIWYTDKVLGWGQS